jgi:hypothetical protein
VQLACLATFVGDARYAGNVNDLLRATLPAALLAKLPAPLRARDELRALREAIVRDGEGREQYLQTLAWNLPRMTALDRLLAAAEQQGVKLVPIKGALLARTHYGDLGARAMVDVDVVCEPRQLDAAIAVGERLGFTRVDPPPFRRARDAVHDVKLVDGAATIEVHHRLWHELRIDRDVSGLVSRARRVPFGDGEAWAPADADHLYVVLVHAALHGFTGNPAWLADAALIVARAGADVWRDVETLARAAGAELPLAAAREHLAAVLPVAGAVVDERRWPMQRALLRTLAPWLQTGEARLGPWPSRLVRPLLFDRARDAGGWALEKLGLWRDRE